MLPTIALRQLPFVGALRSAILRIGSCC